MATQEDVISWVQNLVPELNNTAAPEPVLLKFAKEKNLPAAQLEKLAQVYNTAKANSYMDKNSDNRAGAFHVIDTPALVVEYSKSALAKAASTVTKSASTAATVTVLSAVPNLVELNDDFEKSASDLVGAIDEAHDHYCKKLAAFEDIEVMRKEAEEVDQEAFEARIRVTQNTEKVAGLLKEREVDFTQAHQDAWFDCGSNHNFEKIALALNSHHFMNVKCAEDSGPRRLMEPQDQMIHDLLLKIATDMDYVTAAEAVLEEYAAQEKVAHEDIGLEKDTDGVDKFASSLLEFVKNPVAEAKTEKNEELREEAKSPGGSDPNVSRPAAPESAGLKTPPPSKALTPPESGIKGLTAMPTANPRHHYDKQKTLDEVATSTRMNAVLQGLLMSDDVLKDLDESTEQNVIDAFNLIARNAPHIAMDPTSVRQHLRGVVEYGGMTPQDLDTILSSEGSIIDLKEKALKLEQKERDAVSTQPSTFTGRDR